MKTWLLVLGGAVLGGVATYLLLWWLVWREFDKR